MWLIAIPGLLFGTIQVLAPLRFDELGAERGADRRRVPRRRRARDRREPGDRALVGPARAAGPALFGLGAGVGLMLLFTLPEQTWQLFVLVMLAAPLVGTLWAPSMAMVSDGAEALGIAQGLAFALTNLGWSVGQTVGSAASAGLADATSDAVPYLLLSAICAATLAVLVRARRQTAVLT